MLTQKFPDACMITNKNIDFFVIKIDDGKWRREMRQLIISSSSLRVREGKTKQLISRFGIIFSVDFQQIKKPHLRSDIINLRHANFLRQDHESSLKVLL